MVFFERPPQHLPDTGQAYFPGVWQMRGEPAFQSVAVDLVLFQRGGSHELFVQGFSRLDFGGFRADAFSVALY